MREWLSGRALPCQGKCRGFESRLPLHIWYHRQAVRQRSAKPLFPGSNPGGTSTNNATNKGRYIINISSKDNMPVWRNGRRTGLKIPSSQGRVGSTPTTGTKKRTKFNLVLFLINLFLGIEILSFL